ncbi:MAG: helix-turn-helix transcriptional regulator [Acidimicrobiia bacterium]
MGRRDDLAEFLRARRAAVNPRDVGLPEPDRHDSGRRRAPGLRREEVALLAGVSVSWYTWLEQGRPINASRQVLDALARTLRLDAAQHAHLLALASDPEASSPIDIDVPDAIARLLGALDPSPAYVLGPRWEFLAWNEAQARLFPQVTDLDARQRNLLWIVFAAPSIRDLIVDWENEARFLLAQFRADTASMRDDPLVAALVSELRERSDEFRTWWAQHDVSGFHTRLRRYHHGEVGDLIFEYQLLASVEWPQLRVVAQLPVPGDDSTARLAGG